jgi:YkoY family integral membrane protein
MDISIILEYGWVLLVLIGLEGILAADNAVVMAVMVKHLPKEQQKRALFYGLLGAFVFRFASLFLITFLVNIWQIQAIGALYLLFIMFNHFIKLRKEPLDNVKVKKEKKQSGFWMTVLKVELADIAFAIDSMLAAVALAVTLPEVGNFNIGGINGGQFTVMFLGGLIGLVIIRFAATWFVKLLGQYPTLEHGAFAIVGWVGVKLVVSTLAHPGVAILPEHFPHSGLWKLIFWGVLIGIVLVAYLTSVKSKNKVVKTENGKKELKQTL